MSIFTPTIYNEPSFSGLFRLLDDFDSYRSAASPNANANPNSGGNGNSQHQRQLAGPRHHAHLPTFHPKFDLQETATAYELHGELPGIAKDEIHVEFTDPHTLTIRGKVERSYTKTSDSHTDNEGKAPTSPLAAADASSASAPTPNDKKGTDNTTSTEVTTTTTTNANKQDNQGPPQAVKPRYWLSERSVGEFSRSFNLAGGPGADEELDHEGVKASLNDGVLHVIIPKVKREEKVAKRRVMIE